MSKIFVVLFTACTALAQIAVKESLLKEAEATWSDWKHEHPGVSGLLRASEFREPFSDMAIRELSLQLSKLTQEQRITMLDRIKFKSVHKELQLQLINDVLSGPLNEEDLGHLLYIMDMEGPVELLADAQSRCCGLFAGMTIEDPTVLNRGMQKCPKDIGERALARFVAERSEMQLYAIVSSQIEYTPVWNARMRYQALRHLLNGYRSKDDLMLLRDVSREFDDLFKEILYRLLTFPLSPKEHVNIQAELQPRNDNTDSPIAETEFGALYDRVCSIEDRWVEPANK